MCARTRQAHPPGDSWHRRQREPRQPPTPGRPLLFSLRNILLVGCIPRMPHVVALAGGVGGSRFARGLHAAAPDAELTVIVNPGDDVTLHGLRISPDVDTVLYALAGLVDEKRGWGARGDTFRSMDQLERLGGETWFRLGDLDLAMHLRRTELLADGWPASRVIAELAQRLNIDGVEILPMTDTPVETWVELRDERSWVHF